MKNERLQSAITAAGMSVATFADRVGVDAKTVERWITTDRVPYLAHRMKAAAILERSDGYLWPPTETGGAVAAATRAEIIAVYPSRGAVRGDMWVTMIRGAQHAIDILAYAGSFLHDSVPEFGELLRERAEQGVTVRLLFGDPESGAVALRGQEEGIGDLVAARCRLTWKYLETIDAAGIEVRRHDTTLYASLFRFDDEMLVNPHAYGAAASHSPVFHVAAVAGGRLFSHYLDSLESVWAVAQSTRGVTLEAAPIGGGGLP
jgi:hypothetical protein